jgi:hypothetical protein
MSLRNAAIVMLAVCGLALMATGASAGIIQANSTADPFYQYEPSSQDLINQGEASLDSVVWTGYPGVYELAPLSVMNDGTAGPLGDYANSMVSMDACTPSGIFFLKGSSTGYDVTEIDSYACWYAPRNMQRFQVFYSVTSDPAYVSGNLPHQLGGDFAYTDMLNDQQIIGTKVALTDSSGKLLSGVTAIQFTFLDAGTGLGDPVNPDTLNRTSYREIDVIGTASVPEPSAIALLAAGALSLIAYAWRKRR